MRKMPYTGVEMGKPGVRFIEGSGPKPPAPFDDVENMLEATDTQLAPHGLEILHYVWDGSPYVYVWEIVPRI